MGTVGTGRRGLLSRQQREKVQLRISLFTPVSTPAMDIRVCNEEKRERQIERREGGVSSVRVKKKGSLCSQVSYAFVTMPEGGRGGGGGGG